MFRLRYLLISFSVGPVCCSLQKNEDVSVLRALASEYPEKNTPVVVGQTFLAGSMDPTDGSAGWALTSHGVAEKLFTVDKNDEIVGQVADSVTKVSELVWELNLKPDYFFSDGSPVNAQNVAACLADLNNNNSNARTSLGKIEVQPTGDLQVTIESERPTHVMDAVLAEWAFVVFLKNDDGTIVYTGPYEIETFDADQTIHLIPNQFYDKADERPNIVVQKFSDGYDLAEGMKNHEVDIGFHLPIDTLPDLRKEDQVHVKSFEVGYHYMMFHNVMKLQDARVRKAIDLAIDRQALSQALAGGTPTRSIFPDYSPYFWDESDTHGDLSAAKALLDEAGWTLDSNGKRMKNGTELSVRIVAYPHRPGLVIMQPVIAEALSDLGITVESVVTGQEWKETSDIIDQEQFDLLLWAQHTLPAGDPLWFLSSFFRSDGSNNHANFKSDSVDSLIDELSVAEDHSMRVASSTAVQKALMDEMPVSNLVTPFWHVGVSDRMKDYEPWGSDYYVIRSDLFVSAVSDLEVESASQSSGNRNSAKGMIMALLMVGLKMLIA